MLASLSSTLDVYHVNPYHLGQLPVDMDVADLRGDIFFDLSSRTIPLACRNDSAAPMSKHDCTNAETQSPDVVVSKVKLQMRSMQPSFGPYAACNVCPPSGVDDYSKLPCRPDSYICTCRQGNSTKWPWKLERCDNHTHVGRQEVKEYFASWPPCSWETWLKAPYACWWEPVVNITGGTWFSLTQGGWCDRPGANQSTCTWRASVEKVVNRTCSDDRVFSAIEKYDAARDGCFRRCPGFGNTSISTTRNTSDACWIYCLYATIVGPSALVPDGRQNVSAMPIEVLEEAFSQPFLNESEGGCPALKTESGVKSEPDP